MAQKLIVTAFKEAQKEGTTLSQDGLVRTKDATGNASISLSVTTKVLIKGKRFNNVRYANFSPEPEELVALIAKGALVAGYDMQEDIADIMEDGHDRIIVSHNSLVPFYAGQKPMKRKKDGSTMCDKDGAPIYGETFLDIAGTPDVLVDVAPTATPKAVTAEEVIEGAMEEEEQG
jgi:hypothetical protein